MIPELKQNIFETAGPIRLFEKVHKGNNKEWAHAAWIVLDWKLPVLIKLQKDLVQLENMQSL